MCGGFSSRASRHAAKVSPAESARYHGDTFACEEGLLVRASSLPHTAQARAASMPSALRSTKLPTAAVNDDFCDCEDRV